MQTVILPPGLIKRGADAAFVEPKWPVLVCHCMENDEGPLIRLEPTLSCDRTRACSVLPWRPARVYAAKLRVAWWAATKAVASGSAAINHPALAANSIKPQAKANIAIHVDGQEKYSDFFG